MMKLETKDQNIFDSICSGLSFLEDFRYEITKLSKSKDDEETTLSVEYTFNNLVISYQYNLGNSDIPEMAFIYISKGNDEFMLQHFLKSIGQEEKYNFVNVNKLSDEEFINSTLSAFKEIVHTHLSSVIKGNEWIDVPFDWHGYK